MPGCLKNKGTKVTDDIISPHPSRTFIGAVDHRMLSQLTAVWAYVISCPVVMVPVSYPFKAYRFLYVPPGLTFKKFYMALALR